MAKEKEKEAGAEAEVKNQLNNYLKKLRGNQIRLSTYWPSRLDQISKVWRIEVKVLEFKEV